MDLPDRLKSILSYIDKSAILSKDFKGRINSLVASKDPEKVEEFFREFADNKALSKRFKRDLFFVLRDYTRN